ncbi:MAG TPA: UvrD-helicase domain-containing protein [Thermoleophilaceae bacterium]|nr:UvrD-helicase domain-containing protein [Thermoleophilaceae bacterium]
MTAHTTAQAEAIARRGESLFVDAGAGSGKTRVLVERFVGAVVEDGVGVERILAITFTEKAAGELKRRIRDRLLEAGERDLARDAESAWVSTIHGFCSRVLRTHSLRAGLDPRFRVLDEAEAGRLSVDAFDLALEAFLEEEGAGERLQLAADYTPEKLQGMVVAVHERLRSRGERRPELPLIDPPADTGQAARLEAAARAAVAALAGVPGTTVDKVLAAMRKVIDAADAGAEVPSGCEARRGRTTALAIPEVDEYCEAYAAAMALQEGRAAHADYLLMRDLLRLYGESYERLKDDRSGLDFSDLELLARDLLAGSEELREAYRSRFDHVLVDEYQDTNRLQAEIAGLVAREDNLFTVGDAQQSIYRFRNADVEVFRAAASKADADGRLVRLSESFRARAEVLDAVALAFGRAFDEFVPLEPAEPAASQPAVSLPSVELVVVDRKAFEKPKDDEDEFGCGRLGTDVVWRVIEARMLARRIDDLVAGGAEPGEIVVLLRALTDASVFERALQDRGLPTYVVGGRGYYAQQQVADLRAWLAMLANPRDDLAVLSVLASPLVGLSLDSLAIIGRQKGRHPWWAIESAFGGDGCDGLAGRLAPEDRGRLSAFAALVREERALAPRVSLEVLIDRAVTRTGYDRAILALAGGERRFANVRKLMRLAREYEADEGRDLRGFLDHLDERDLVRAREGEAPVESEGMAAVRLMTVHAAKGLEFPVVCVADTGRGGKIDDTELRVTEDGRVGLKKAALGRAAKAVLDQEEIKAEEAAADEAEEKRVTYVAMTRAERHLIVSGATDLAGLPEPEPRGEPMRWIHRELAPGGVNAALEAGGTAEWTGERDGRPVVVGVVCATPDTVDAVIEADDRDPVRLRPPAQMDLFEEVPPFEAVEVPAPLPLSRLSYSRLQSYRACGYRFYAERILGLEAERPRSAPVDAEDAPAPGADEAPVELTAMLRGSVVHELLEELDFASPRAPSDEAVVARLAEHGATADAAGVRSIAGLVEGFGRSALRARLSAASGVRRELPFAYELAPDSDGRSLLVTGIVDVLAEEESGALVLDYKSDALGGRDPAAVADEAYSTQRIVYALAALRAGYERVEVTYCFLERPDEPAVRVYEKADAGTLEQELLSLAGNLLAGEFVPAPEPHADLCRTCPARASLCSWGPDRTLGPKVASAA